MKNNAHALLLENAPLLILLIQLKNKNSLHDEYPVDTARKHNKYNLISLF